MDKKETYEQPNIVINFFDKEDIITTSGDWDDEDI